jgi:hypothetical protein
VKKQYLIKVWFFHEDNESPPVIRGRMLERFSFLEDALENIEIIPLNKGQEKTKKGQPPTG